jgi:hypothetical protein
LLPASKVSGAAVHGSVVFRVANEGNIASFGTTTIQVERGKQKVRTGAG